ncbi:MAG: hypothetical protein ABIP95_02150 [Pelobium sp.]
MQAGIITALHRGEDIINQSGASVRALRCPVFFESLLYQMASLKKTGMFFLPINGNYKIPQVAVKDIASKAVEFLTDKTWTGVEGFAIQGSANISYNEVAVQLSELTGKAIRFQQVSEKDYIKTLLEHHSTSEAFANSLTEMLTAIGNGLYETEQRTEASTTPTTIKDWMSENLVSKIN